MTTLLKANEVTKIYTLEGNPLTERETKVLLKDGSMIGGKLYPISKDFIPLNKGFIPFGRKIRNICRYNEQKNR